MSGGHCQLSARPKLSQSMLLSAYTHLAIERGPTLAYRGLYNEKSFCPFFGYVKVQFARRKFKQIVYFIDLTVSCSIKQMVVAEITYTCIYMPGFLQNSHLTLGQICYAAVSFCLMVIFVSY